LFGHGWVSLGHEVILHQNFCTGFCLLQLIFFTEELSTACSEEQGQGNDNALFRLFSDFDKEGIRKKFILKYFDLAHDGTIVCTRVSIIYTSF